VANDDKNANPEPTEPDPPADDAKAAEDKFWARFDERLDAAIERGVTKHVPKRSPGATPRTAGRLTLPQIIADAIGGPFTSESTKQKQSQGK
jgi:hypothetical protein